MKFLARHKILLSSTIIASIVTFLFSYLNGYTLVYIEGHQNTPYEISKLIASIAGTILGFLLTAVAMLTAVMDRKLLENMRKTGHYQVFITDCFINCLLLLLTTILGVSTLFLSLPTLNYIFLGMIFFSISSIFKLASMKI